MNRRTRSMIAVLACILATGVRWPVSAMAEEPVAIVCFLSGTASLRVDGKATALELFQRLRRGAAVEVAADSMMVLAFFTGDRFELSAMSAATVARTGLERRKGPIRALPPVPVMVEIAPIAKDGNAGDRMAGTRIRTSSPGKQSIENLYPSNGATLLAESAVVRFDPVPGYERYRVVVEDDRGNAVFVTDSPGPDVRIPATAIAPGRSYYWSVRTLDAIKPAMDAEALFGTLSEEDARRRAAFKSHVDATGDGTLRGLLAELDRSLGLRQEACEGLKRALDPSRANDGIREALIRFDCVRK